MEKHVEIGYLLDLYGAFLTGRQRDMVEQSVNEDCSLAEIAEREGISRQGVRDAVARGTAQLYAMENRLGLMRINRALRALRAQADVLTPDELRAGLDALIAPNEENNGI